MRRGERLTGPLLWVVAVAVAVAIASAWWLMVDWKRARIRRSQRLVMFPLLFCQHLYMNSDLECVDLVVDGRRRILITVY